MSRMRPFRKTTETLAAAREAGEQIGAAAETATVALLCVAAVSLVALLFATVALGQSAAARV